MVEKYCAAKWQRGSDKAARLQDKLEQGWWRTGYKVRGGVP
jgi:hypothetical protein